MALQGYAVKTVGVVGLARSGLAAIRALTASGARVIVWDDDPKALLQQELAEYHIVVAGLAEDIWQQADAILVSPGISLYYPAEYPLYSLAKKFNIPLVCDIELLAQAVSNAYFIGITGTNGKSTTTALIGHVLKMEERKAFVGGNIGVSALALPQLEDAYYVLEASSYQLDLIDQARFKIAVCLSITPDHIDRHGSFARYAQAKARIFKNHTNQDVAVVSAEHYANLLIIEQLVSRGVPVVQVSNSQVLQSGVSVIDGLLHDNYSATHATYDVSHMAGLIGMHNAENMAAAFAACVAAGIKPANVIEHFKSFRALPHRMQLFHSCNGLDFINDSKATNADSAYWALKSFDEIYWIAGGISKDAGIELLAPLFDRVMHAYLIGQAAEAFSRVLAEHHVPFTLSGTLAEAVAMVKSRNISKGNVLLSPACASFDQWRSYEERGDTFMQLVKRHWSS